MSQKLIEITELSQIDLTEMIAESKRFGFNMIARLKDEWERGVNRFDQQGEFLLASIKNEQVIGIGGITNDPYHPLRKYGRIRRMYVMQKYRRHGIGSEILKAVISRGKPYYDLITLRAPADQSADHFYEQIGFMKCNEIAKVSHIYKCDE